MLRSITRPLLLAALLAGSPPTPAAAPGPAGPPAARATPDASASPSASAPDPAFVLQASAESDSRGVFLAQLGAPGDGRPLPAIRLLPAPSLGSPLALTRARIQEILGRPETGILLTNWSGADQVLVSRRMRKLDDVELLQMLTHALEERCLREGGSLELRFSRPWTPASVPDDPLTLRLVELPLSGIGPLMLVRFELLAGAESAGTWQAVLQARVWREVWVARAALRRGQGISESDLARERRDVLPLRDLLADPAAGEVALQAAESVPAGAPLLQRHLRLQPVVRRGQTVNVIVADGLLNLVLKAEVLEDGAPGQVVRLRNINSRRELRGKVQNEKTIIALL